MARKRMFSASIIESDIFLDLPLATQALYFHLAMCADDDGVVNNVKKLIRSLRSRQKNFDQLVDEGFVIYFDSGVCVIRHWNQHNCIPKNRYSPSVYQEELGTLGLDSTNLYTQVRLDQSSIDQSSGGKERAGQEPPPKKPEEDVCGQVLTLYRTCCPSLPAAETLTSARRQAIIQRMGEGISLKDFQTAFEKAERSQFLKGGNRLKWRVTFDWLLEQQHLAKVLEGNYDGQLLSSGSGSGSSWERSYDLEFLERHWDKVPVLEIPGKDKPSGRSEPALGKTGSSP